MGGRRLGVVREADGACPIVADPRHSTRPRTRATRGCQPAGDRYRVLAIVPAFNEASNLVRVVRELHDRTPVVDILVVNDGSTDDTADCCRNLGVGWLSLTERMGVGGAVRAGLRYAVREGYEYVVRVDGDGQHRACDIARLLAPVSRGRLDAVIGSRYLGRPFR